MKEMFVLGIKLLIITAVSALVLAFTNSVTAPIIAENERAANEAARKELLPSAALFEDMNIQQGEIIEVYRGVKDDETEGFVIKTATSGYGGDVVVMTGLDKEGKITKVQVVKHEETPGLGANAKNESFSSQYMGKSNPIQVVKSAPGENDIQAITGATITSKSVTKGVNAALSLYQEKLKN